MFYLIYVSYATEPFSEEELSLLLNQSRVNNLQNEITGMLLYVDGKFIQVLEGNRVRVEALYEKISLDPRHKKVTPILEGIISHRNFDDWSMGFKVLNRKEFKEMSGFTDVNAFFGEGFPQNEAHPVMVFLKLFYNKNFEPDA